jgi:hypothetical protein
LFLVLQENMESCQNHFWGALNTSPPQKKSIFFQEQEISQERDLWLLNLAITRKYVNRANLFGGAIFMFPLFNPPNPVSSWWGGSFVMMVVAV